MYDVLQDDLAGLVSPSCIVVCEGKKSSEGTDARIYNKVFEQLAHISQISPVGAS